MVEQRDAARAVGSVPAAEAGHEDPVGAAGIAAKLQPHLDALELVIRQTLDDSGAEERGAEPESTHPWRRERA
jgi:hypothetical protein